VSQINVNPPVVERDGGDRSAAAGINLITVLVVLVVLAALAWFLFTGPLQGMMSGGTTNVNVSQPAPAQQQAPNVNVNVPAPAQPAQPAQPANKP